MGEKKMCPICKKEQEENLINLCDAAYKSAMEMIKKRHPDWVEQDGACQKCVAYYESL